MVTICGPCCHVYFVIFQFDLRKNDVMVMIYVPCTHVYFVVLFHRWATASGLRTARQREPSSSTWQTECCYVNFSVNPTSLATGWISRALSVSTLCLTPCHFCFSRIIITAAGSWDSFLVRALDLWSKGYEFEYRQEQRENFLLQSQLFVLTLIRCPFHPRVTAVACKRPRSLCQKCRWQVTPKHAYTLDPTKSE